MKALVYDGPRQVSVKDVPDAKIERPTDVLVRITAVNICGSDLHMYQMFKNKQEGCVRAVFQPPGQPAPRHD